MNKFLRNVGFYLLIILVAISIIDYFSVKNTTKQEIGYTEFLQKVDKGEVAKVTLINNMIRGQHLRVTSIEEVDDITTIVSGKDPVTIAMKEICDDTLGFVEDEFDEAIKVDPLNKVNLDLVERA